MSIIVTENFDSYSNTDNLNGKSGGTGFSGAWATYSSVVCSNAQSQSPSISIKKGSSGYVNAYRGVSGIKDSKLVFYVYRVTDTADNFEFYYGSSTNSIRFRVKTSTQWNLDVNGSSQANENGWSNNNWQKIEIAVNQTAGTVAVSLNEAVPVSYSYSNSGNNFNDLYVIFSTADYSEIYVDSIYIDDDLTFDRDKVPPATTANPAFLSQYLAQQ